MTSLVPLPVVRGTTDNDILIGGVDADTVLGGTGHDVLRGGEGNDHLAGDAGNDVIYGGAGRDTLLLGGASVGYTVLMDEDPQRFGIARAFDGSEVDLFQGIENLRGSQFADGLYGNMEANRIEGGSGDDTIYGNGGNDTLQGNQGDDKIMGGDGADVISGGSGGDVVWGDGGNDTIYGQDDEVTGGDGDDLLIGGFMMTGDAGVDRFVVTRSMPDRTYAYIMDLGEGEKVDISALKVDGIGMAPSSGRFWVELFRGGENAGWVYIESSHYQVQDYGPQPLDKYEWLIA